MKYSEQRIPTLNEYCVVCDEQHVFQNGSMLKVSLRRELLFVFTPHDLFPLSSQVIHNPWPVSAARLQFFSIAYTHFWKHTSFSQNSKHKSRNHTHKMQNPTLLLQNATLPSKQCYVSSKWYFVFKWHTQTIIWVDTSKHLLNTDVLKGKHYYEWENTSMKALSGALCLFMFSVTVRLLL